MGSNRLVCGQCRAFETVVFVLWTLEAARLGPVGEFASTCKAYRLARE